MRFKLTYPERIVSRRRELGMTIKDVADISRVDYKKVQDFELKRYKRVEAVHLEAICYALQIHPLELSADYEPPTMPRLTYVGVDGNQIGDYLKTEGISGLEFAKRARIKHDFIYGITRYGQYAIPADVARKIAKAMGLRGFELAPALGIYPGPHGEETYGDLLGEYGGETPEDVNPIPEA